MLDIRSLMILSTAAILTMMVMGMALMNVGSVTGAQGLVVQSFNHREIVVRLSATGPAWLEKVEVNGLTVWKGRLAITPSNPVILIESIGSVRTFHSVSGAVAYATKGNRVAFPGRPLPNTSLYLVKLYFSDGTVVSLTLRAPS